MSADHVVIAKVGRVTGRIAPGQIGEVVLAVRGGFEAFNAYAVDPSQEIEVGTRVVVVEQDSARTVRVEPYE
jgi:hypothetical protein